jgi:hydroxyacyl-ACP dehydratase HTD2-like protein with hotdog domain
MPYEDYLGQCETVEDEVSAAWLESAAAVLGAAAPADGCVPPLWHWMLFCRWPKALRPDGGVQADGFLPPFGHLPRRMGAGGRLTFHRPLHLGDRVVRTSRIHAIADKVGRSGPLVLLTIARTVTVGGEEAISEQQDLVYLTHSPTTDTHGAPVAADNVAAAVTQRCSADAVALFRYSALSGNSHRIHYDQGYAREVEGFPGLVVHGPLQATWLAGLAAAAEPVRRLASIRYRHVGAAYHTDQLEACARREGGEMRLALRKANGEGCTEAAATFAAQEASGSKGRT